MTEIVLFVYLLIGTGAVGGLGEQMPVWRILLIMVCWPTLIGYLVGAAAARAGFPKQTKQQAMGSLE